MRLELVARGGFSGQAAASESYRITVSSPDGQGESISGEFQRSWHSVRVGRRGRAQEMTEHVVNLHRLSQTYGPHVVLTLEDVGGSARVPVHITLQPAGVPLWAVIVLCGLLLAGALALDLWLDQTQAATHLFAGASFGAVFAYLFPDMATARPVVGSLGAAIAAVLGAIVGLLLTIAVRRLLGIRQARARRAAS